MTDTITLTGQIIGQAERATRAVLDSLLDELDTSFRAWVTLNVLAVAGGVLDDEALAQRVAIGLRIDGRSARAALDELAVAGLVRRTAEGGAGVELTASGDERHRQVRAGIDAIAERLYGDLSDSDLATAGRVLTIVTERATAELAG